MTKKKKVIRRKRKRRIEYAVFGDYGVKKYFKDKQKAKKYAKDHSGVVINVPYRKKRR